MDGTETADDSKSCIKFNNLDAMAGKSFAGRSSKLSQPQTYMCSGLLDIYFYRKDNQRSVLKEHYKYHEYHSQLQHSNATNQIFNS